MNDSVTGNENVSSQQTGNKSGCSCFSCLAGLLHYAFYLGAAGFLATFLLFCQASAGYVLLTAGILIVACFWQRRAARRGCLMPVVILAMFLFSEFFLLGVLLVNTDRQNNSNFKELEKFLAREAPGLYPAFSKALDSVSEQSRLVLDSGLQTLQGAMQSISMSDDEKKIATLEEAFRNTPGDAAVVLALADAYMGKKDLVSLRLATALYEALVETAPCDAYLARLADAYGKNLRYDLAFATAAKRLWLPHAMFAKAARQLALLAVTSGNLARGIFELERILQLQPVESEEIMLLLAGLYSDIGNPQQAQLLLDRVIAETPAELSVYQAAVSMKQTMGN